MSRYAALTAATAAKPTALLLDALDILDAAGRTTDAERITYGTICQVLEDRFPAAVDRMDEWCELVWGEGLTYGQALRQAIWAVR